MSDGQTTHVIKHRGQLVVAVHLKNGQLVVRLTCKKKKKKISLFICPLAAEHLSIIKSVFHGWICLHNCVYCHIEYTKLEIHSLLPPFSPSKKKNKQRGEGGSFHFVGCLMSQQHASVSQGWICTILRAARLRQKLQIKLSTSPSHSILTPG